MSDSEFSHLSNYLRMHRRRWTLSQAELAELLGLEAGQTVSRYEKGGSQPSLEVALMYQALFDVSVRELFLGVAEGKEAELLKRVRRLLVSLPDPEMEPSAAPKVELLASFIARQEDA